MGSVEKDKSRFDKIEMSVRPYKLRPATLAAIGRIVRACAEIEDILYLYFERVSGIHEMDQIMLLGRSSISAKLRIIDNYVGAKSTPTPVYDEFLKPNGPIRHIMKARNILAHGALHGLTDDGKIAFKTVEVTEHFDEFVAQKTYVYSAEDISNLGRLAESMASEFERRLELKAFREKRFERGLFRPKSHQGKGAPSSKPSHPPQSSET